MAEPSLLHNLPDLSFEAFFERHDQPMWLVHVASGRILKANPAALELYGFTVQDLGELTLLDFTGFTLPDLGQQPTGKARVRQRKKNGEQVVTELSWQTFSNQKALFSARSLQTEVALQQQLEHQTWQLQKLAALPRLLTPETSMEVIHQTITDAAREIIGAHQAVTSISHNQDWAQMISALSLSDKYAAYRDFDPPPTGKGIYVMVCESNRPVRMTQEELKGHPRWLNFSEHRETHPPMRGWLAAPLIGRDGKNLGLIQLSDKLEGDFTELDEIMLMQFAHFASSIIEGSMLLQHTLKVEQRMNIALQAAEVGVWEWDFVNNDLFWDEKTAELMGVPLEQFTHRIEDFYQAVSPHDIEVVGARIEQARIAHLPFEASFRVKAWGEERHLLSRGRFHYHEDGTAYLFTGVLMDNTERIQALARLQENEQRLRELMDVQKRFVADAAHELRTPLTAIQGNLDMFTRFPDIPEADRKEILRDVQREATRLGRLVHDMLQLARGDAGAVLREDEVRLDQIVKDAWKQFERVQHHHQLVLGPIEPLSLYGDSDRLKQLTLILLENAVKYTAPGGLIRIALEKNEGRAELRIADTGYGISEEDLPRVFERFYRAAQSRHRGEDPGGTGLGLPIAKWIVEGHGGKIWLESQPGRGTTAVVQLPLIESGNG